jgi:iron-sulfur cluster repair protein YtfE (RIC family)
MERYSSVKWQHQFHEVTTICNDIETNFHSGINRGANKIASLLHDTKNLPNIRPSICGLVQAAYYELYTGIERWMIMEKIGLFPILQSGVTIKRADVLNKIEAIREAHSSILNVVQKLRGLLCNQGRVANVRAEFKDIVRELFLLENNIYKWILAESNLFAIILHKVTIELTL